MLTYFLHLLDQGSDIKELVACKVRAASNCGCRGRLYRTVWRLDANIHFGGRQVHYHLQGTADVCKLGILDEANLGHYEAPARFECLHDLLILGSVLRGFLEVCLAILAWVVCAHEGGNKVGSLSRLSLPCIFVFILEGAVSIDNPCSTNLHTCFVKLRQCKVRCAARLSSTVRCCRSCLFCHGTNRNQWASEGSTKSTPNAWAGTSLRVDNEHKRDQKGI
jgi:hypothetical protein